MCTGSTYTRGIAYQTILTCDSLEVRDQLVLYYGSLSLEWCINYAIAKHSKNLILFYVLSEQVTLLYFGFLLYIRSLTVWRTPNWSLS